MTDTLSTRSRVLIAVVTAVVLLGGAIGYVLVSRTDANTDGGHALVRGTRLLVVSGGHLVTVSANDPKAERDNSGVSCVRSYMVRDTGVCLRQDDPWHYSLHTFDADFRDTGNYRIQGLPSRARVSPTGRMVSWTTFIGGDSYAGSNFSTRTGIIDTRTGRKEINLESFTVLMDGKPYEAADINFWGVTFTGDDNTFYATMGTRSTHYLVRGDFAARTVVNIATNVECPSLSPDGTRIAFKQANTAVAGWRIAIMDLTTKAVHPLADARNIDDQPAWLDNETVAYTFRDASGKPSVWSSPSDGTGTPQLRADNAESPAVLPPAA